MGDAGIVPTMRVDFQHYRRATKAASSVFSIFRVAILLLALVAFVSPCAPVDAHADLLRADPAPDALLAAPPRTLDLWLTEPVAEGDGSPSIRLLDQSGRERSITDLTVDPSDP